MTAYLARRVAARLNRLKVPGCEMQSPLGCLLQAWTEKGGQLAVVEKPGGRWIACSEWQWPIWVAEEPKRAK